MKTREMSEDEIQVFFILEIITDADADNLFKQLTETDGGWVLNAIKKRFEAHKMNVDKKVMIMIITLGDGVVGKCAKYVDGLASLGNEFHFSKIEWCRFTNEVYLHGIPAF